MVRLPLTHLGDAYTKLVLYYTAVESGICAKSQEGKEHYKGPIGSGFPTPLFSSENTE